MTQLLDRPKTVTCAKGTLWGLTRTGFLLMGAVLASVLLVEVPVPIGGAADRPVSPSFVPASDEWIQLGAPAHTDPPIVAAGLDPATAPARPGPQSPQGAPGHQAP